MKYTPQILFCRICECDVEPRRTRTGPNATRRDAGKIAIAAFIGFGLAVLFPWAHVVLVSLSIILLAFAVLCFVVGCFLRDPYELSCPLCGRDDFIPTHVPAAQMARSAHYEAYEEPIQPRRPEPMRIAKDFKVTPPSRLIPRPASGKVTIRKFR